VRKTFGIAGFLNECLRHLPRRPPVYLTHLTNHCIWLIHFSPSWRKALMIVLRKPSEVPYIRTEFTSQQPTVQNGQAFYKDDTKMVQRHIITRNLLDASQFGFRARQIMTLQYVRLAEDVILNFDSNIFAAAIFLNNLKAFWHYIAPCFAL
jgi:hypothetical protein